MGQYEDALKVMQAVARYRKDETRPDDPHEIDRLAEGLLKINPLDDIGIEWRRISEYEREVHGGDWPKPD